MKELDRFEIIKNFSFNNIIPNAFEFTGVSLQKTIECFEIDIARLKRKRIIELLTELLELDKKLIGVEKTLETILIDWFENNNIEFEMNFVPLCIYFTILDLNFKYLVESDKKHEDLYFQKGLFYQKYNKEINKYINYPEKDNLESEDYFKLENLTELLIP